jgi:hypothetical protein
MWQIQSIVTYIYPCRCMDNEPKELLGFGNVQTNKTMVESNIFIEGLSELD